MSSDLIELSPDLKELYPDLIELSPNFIEMSPDFIELSTDFDQIIKWQIISQLSHNFDQIVSRPKGEQRNLLTPLAHGIVLYSFTKFSQNFDQKIFEGIN